MSEHLEIRYPVVVLPLVENIVVVSALLLAERLGRSDKNIFTSME
jgi:hypothetical protein